MFTRASLQPGCRQGASGQGASAQGGTGTHIPMSVACGPCGTTLNNDVSASTGQHRGAWQSPPRGTHTGQHTGATRVHRERKHVDEHIIGLIQGLSTHLFNLRHCGTPTRLCKVALIAYSCCSSSSSCTVYIVSWRIPSLSLSLWVIWCTSHLFSLPFLWLVVIMRFICKVVVMLDFVLIDIKK